MNSADPNGRQQPNKNLIPEKPKENWTKFPNPYLDNIDAFTPSEFTIIGVMVRKNLGFQRTDYEFSLTYLCRKSGLTRKTATKATNGLKEKGFIEELKNGDRRVRRFKLVWKKPEEEKTCDTGALEIPIPVEILPTHLQTDSIKEMLQKHALEHAAEFVKKYMEYALKNCDKKTEDSFRAFLDKSMTGKWKIGDPNPPTPADPKCDHEWIESMPDKKTGKPFFYCKKCMVARDENPKSDPKETCQHHDSDRKRTKDGGSICKCGARFDKWSKRVG
jgi:DNA-binding MarR family transcriptional regulator